MRLIRCRDIKIIYVQDEEIHKYPYAILSHTWLEDNSQEATYSDCELGIERQKDGYVKIRFCIEQAIRDGLQYCWVDTCCIDKRNSQELTEAITSMFAWYRSATVCYVYLTDVLVDVMSDDEKEWPTTSIPWESAFLNSRWFTRGCTYDSTRWTLQELLAPTNVKFFSKDEVYIGDKDQLQGCISEFTGIPIRALKGADLNIFSVEERFAWSQRRKTKRKEDKAYCMLGIFDVFIPMMYGERDNAVWRLKEAIRTKQHEHAQQEEILVTMTCATGAAFNSQYNSQQPMCHPATRRELLDDFYRWMQSADERCLCWLNGRAGTGKSTIARTIANTYHEHGKLGASFFFSKGSGDLSNTSRFVASICRQLAETVPAMRRYLCEAIQNNDDAANLPLRDQWYQFILGPLSKVETTRCPAPLLLVIDALDECDSERDMREILRLLISARSVQNVRLRILITGRPELPVLAAFRTIPEAERYVFTLHDVASGLINRDIRLFFETQFASIRDHRRLPKEWPGQRNMNMLVESSCGLFIWSSIACRFIREGRLFSQRRISKLIGEHRSRADPERQLDHIYRTVLENTVPDDADTAQRTFQIGRLKDTLGRLIALRSPLSMESLAFLLGRPFYNIQESLTKISTVLRNSTGISDPIYLYHPTLRDFLLDEARSGSVNFWIDEKEMNRALAESCVTFLSEELGNYLEDSNTARSVTHGFNGDTLTQRKMYALRYACLYWVEHHRRGGVRLQDNDRVHRFFETYFSDWFEVMRRLGKNPEIGAIVRLYHSLLKPADNTRQLAQVKSARRFIVTFETSMRCNPPQQLHSTGTNFYSSSYPPSQQQVVPDTPSRTSQLCSAEALNLREAEEYNYVNDLVFTPDGKKIASGSSIGVVRLWDFPTMSKSHELCGGFKEKVSSIAISACGKWLAAGSDDYSVVIWALESRQKLYTLERHSGWVNSIVFSPDSMTLATGSMDETILLWSLETGQQIGKLQQQISCVNSLIWSPNGDFIATGSVDGVIRLWNVSTSFDGQPLMLDGDGGCINSIKFSPDGSHVVSGSDDMMVRLWSWDWETQTVEEKLSVRDHSKKVVAVTFSPNGCFVVSGSEDRTLRVWDSTSGQLCRILRQHNTGINAVAFSPCGAYLASGSFDGHVRLWDAQSWDPVGSLEEFEIELLETSVNAMGMVPAFSTHRGFLSLRNRTLSSHFTTVH